MYEYRLNLIRVVDADTIDVVIDLGCYVGTSQRVRLNGVNAPEKNTHEGRAAKAWVEEWFASRDGKPLTVLTIKDKREKYGRLLAEIWCDGESLTRMMKDAGHCKHYDGKGPKP